MIFYRLVICRLTKFLGWDEVLEERERRAIMLGKKKKPFHKPKLLMDEKMKTYVLLLLAVINLLFMLTLPISLMEEPCEAFKKNNMPNFYAFTLTVKKYSKIIDRLMVLLSVVLVVLAVKTVLDAIAVTKINMSPWLEQGKYRLPGPDEAWDNRHKDPAKERAKARARAKYIEDVLEYEYKKYHEEHNW